MADSGPPISFLSVEDVLLMHEETVRIEGGASGVRDTGLLDSAVSTPRQRFEGRYLHDDLAAMAAAYAFHIMMNHPFVDGNKRVAALASFVFLDRNGYDVTASEDDFTRVILEVASSRMTKPELITWMRLSIRPRQTP